MRPTTANSRWSCNGCPGGADGTSAFQSQERIICVSSSAPASLPQCEEAPSISPDETASSVEGCLELSRLVQEAAAGSGSGNAQRCARLSRRVRNLTPLLEKLGPKLSVTFISPLKGRPLMTLTSSGGGTSSGSVSEQQSSLLVKPSILSLPQPPSESDCSGGGSGMCPRQYSQADSISNASTPASVERLSSLLSPLPLSSEAVEALTGRTCLQTIASKSCETLLLDGGDSSPTTCSLIHSGHSGQEGNNTQHESASTSAEDQDVVATALEPRNSGKLPASVLDTLSPVGGASLQRNERLLADQIVADCHTVIADSLAWILTWGYQQQHHQLHRQVSCDDGSPSLTRQDSSDPADGGHHQGPHIKAYSALNDRLSGAFSDLMYLALAFNINVEHQPGNSLLFATAGGPQPADLFQLQADQSGSMTSDLQPGGSFSARRQQRVRELVLALVQQEWMERHQRGASEISSPQGSNRSVSMTESNTESGSVVMGSDALPWLSSLSPACRERLLMVLSAHELQLIAFQAITALSHPSSQHDAPTVTSSTVGDASSTAMDSSVLAAHLLAILPPLPLPVSSLARAQEDTDWP